MNNITYRKQDGTNAVGAEWSLGPVLRKYRDTKWLVAESGRPVLVGIRRGDKSPKPQRVEIAEIPEGCELEVSQDLEPSVRRAAP